MRMPWDSRLKGGGSGSGLCSMAIGQAAGCTRTGNTVKERVRCG